MGMGMEMGTGIGMEMKWQRGIINPYGVSMREREVLLIRVCLYILCSPFVSMIV